MIEPCKRCMKSMSIGLMALVAMASSTALAGEPTITLRLADSLPIGHIIHEAVTKPFIEAVEKRTDGGSRLRIPRRAARQGEGPATADAIRRSRHRLCRAVLCLR